MTLADQFRPGTFPDALRFIWHNAGFLLARTGEHLELSFAALGIALLLSLPLGLWLGHRHRGLFLAVSVSNVGRALPSLVLIAVGLTIFGVGFWNNTAALVVLAVPPILTNAYFGIDSVDRDVVEAFIATDAEKPRHYAEFQVAPTNERLDLMVVNLPEKDFEWTSHFQSVVKVDTKARMWKCELRIPLSALSATPPVAETRWRLNLLHRDCANHASLAWSPPLSSTFHVPEKFGVLEFVE